MIDSSGDISTLSYPTGMIMLWYPPDSTLTNLALVSSTIPTGWAICDGTKGTPDLRGRFVLMAHDSYAVMSTGGSATHTLTEAEMPSHTHGYKAHSGWGGDARGGSYSHCDISKPPPALVTDPKGGNQPHNNMPPYYTLVYIMKL